MIDALWTEGATATPSEPSDSALRAEVDACLPLLPVLATQLRDTIREVEEAVVGVCGSFQEIAKRAREVVSSGVMRCSQSGPDQEGSGVAGLIEDTRRTMGLLLQRIEQSSQISSATVDRMQEIEKRMQGLHETLADIDRISAQARLLAFNGQLEAARAGEYGAAFGIVATETAKMAQHTVDASKSIRQMIATLSTSLTEGTSELRQRAEVDRQEADSVRGEVTRSLDSLAALHSKFCRAVEETKLNSRQVGEDLSQAIVAMQFQDAMSQRVGHVAHTLEEIHEVLETRLAEENDDRSSSARVSHHDWSNRMRDRYTMAAEHKAMSSHGGFKAAGDEGLGDNVQLF